MKIGIEIQRLFRKKKYGIETSSLELINKIKELDPKYDFVIYAKNDADRECFTPSGKFRVKTLPGQFFADFEQIYLPIASKLDKLDLLHCTGNTTPYFSSVPVVQTLHDIIFMDTIPRNDNLYQRFGNLYRRKLVPMVSPNSEKIITVSQYEKERILSRLPLDESKIEVIYNGINEKHFRICRDSKRLNWVRVTYSLPKKFILFLGNPSFRKNPTGVIEAYVIYASKVKDPLPLVTPGLTQKYIIDVLKQLKTEFDPARFITPGYIMEEDLPIVYGLSEVFLFPSLSEGFGMPIVEAMSCGTPVITSKISSMPEIAGKAAVLVDPLSAPSIADGLVRLLGNVDLKLDLIQSGLKNVKRFSWNKTAEKVLTIYDRILQPHKRVAKRPNRKKTNLEPIYYFFQRLKQL
jgi:glycosyltransferase involved in cell wall biosynthesis